MTSLIFDSSFLSHLRLASLVAEGTWIMPLCLLMHALVVLIRFHQSAPTAVVVVAEIAARARIATLMSSIFFTVHLPLSLWGFARLARS